MNIEEILKDYDLPLNKVVVGVLLIFIPLFTWVTYTFFISEGLAFPISLMALFAGLFFESLLIVGKWKILVLKIVAAYVLSLYFLDQIDLWPYGFMFIYSLIIIVTNKQKTMLRLTEGITLLQSLSILYWIANKGLLEIRNGFVYALLIVLLSFTLFSTLHALFYFKLTRAARLTLSIWSALIMFVFAIDNTWQVHHNDTIEHVQHWYDGAFIALQYFLLGVSTIYMVQNFLLLYCFLPEKREKYGNTLREAIEKHLERYSDQQVNRLHAFLCISYALSLYAFNYYYNWLPPLTMIWLVFFTFALLVNRFSRRAEA